MTETHSSSAAGGAGRHDEASHPSTSHDEAVLLLAHRWSPRIARSIERFRAEAGAVVPVFFVFSLPNDDAGLPDGCRPDLVVRPSDARPILPSRVAYAERRHEWIGSADRFTFPVMEGPLAAYDHIWLIEYDVDFAGDWGDFFRSVKGAPGDYLATHIRRPDEDPEWAHWLTFVPPPSVPRETWLASFHPVSRYSRRLRRAYIEAVEQEGWAGHTEVLYPTIAVTKGLEVVDLGGAGPFVPAAWTGRHYRPTDSPDRLSDAFRYRPPVAYDFYVNVPEAFPVAGLLYHPIKDITAVGPSDNDVDPLEAWPSILLELQPPPEPPPVIQEETQQPVEPEPIVDVPDASEVAEAGEVEIVEAPPPPPRVKLTVAQKMRREVRRVVRQVRGLLGLEKR